VHGDVTPVGWRAGPTRRKRGWLRILLGLLLTAGGLAGLGLGIVATIDERDRIDDDAVARGVPGETLTFEATEAGDYTVFLIFHGGVLNSTRRQERAVRNTECQADLAGTGRTVFTGARQGVSTTIGSASSVGRFDTGPGQVTVLCQTFSGDDEYAVTAGRPAIWRSVLMIIAGAIAAAGGIGLLIWGLIGKRVPV
jgi:hypothetical protein